MFLDNDRRPALSPQLAIRIAVMGGFALVMFAVVFFRLWYLQVLSGDRYLREANNNRIRDITIPAPRGDIVDRNGRLLVENRVSLVVELQPNRIPHRRAARARLYRRLGSVLGTSPRRIRRNVRDQLKALPFSGAVVKSDVSRAQMGYILEHQSQFRGVTVQPVFLRSYPHHSIGAHLFGTVGEVTAQQLKNKRRYEGVKMGDRVGQSGIEYAYDRYLRGVDGAQRAVVDARGELRDQLSSIPPRSGHQLRLSIDLGLQQLGQQAISGDEGAFVVMDVHTGEIRALGSNPSFDPNVFAKVIRKSDYQRLTSPANGAPLADRAIQGLYPTGSTFKLITATAALEGGVITPYSVLYDPGYFKIGGVTFHNAEGAVHGALALRQALTVSDDVFFYQLGADMNGAGDGHLIQRWAARYGLGRRTGIDLPGELPGLIPSPEWRDRLFRKHLTDRPWSAGDNVNLAVGQGDVQVTPLQLATAYAALANGGYLVKPHLGERIEDDQGRVIQEFNPPPRRRIHLAPAYRQAILDGIRGAASQPGGTSYSVFHDFPIPIAGKTGTAERGAGRPDQSWYVALAPYPAIRYVVVATAEHGGFGVQTAAPEVKRILAALFHVHATKTQPTQATGPYGQPLAAPILPAH